MVWWCFMPVYRRDFLAGSVATLALAAGLGRWDLGDDGQLVTGSIQGMTPPDENPSSQLAERYLDRGAIRRQTVAPPGLIGAILSPTLGAPARAVADPASGASRFSIVLTGSLSASSHLILIPRDELSGIDEDLYALPPLPGGHDLIRARLRQAAQRLDGTAATGPGLPSWEWEWQRLVRQDTNWAQAVTRQLDRIALDSDEDCRAAIRRIVAKVADYVRQPSRPRMMLTCSSWQRLGKAEAWTAEAAGDLAPGLYALALVTPTGRFSTCS